MEDIYIFKTRRATAHTKNKVWQQDTFRENTVPTWEDKHRKRDINGTYDVTIYQQWVKEWKEGDTYSRKVTKRSGAEGGGKWKKVIGCNKEEVKEKGNITGGSPREMW